MQPHSLPDDSAAWQAVSSRDAAWDGRLFYGVSTTGVFCRPSCPSRRAKRANVRFYATTAAAESAGFRPCRRCRPTEPREALPRAVGRARDYLDSHADERVTLAALARAVGQSPWHIQRIFRQHLGVSPAEYQRRRRADRLKQELKTGQSVSRATYQAGYGSSSRAYDAASRNLGMTPGTYRRGGQDMSIRYTIVATPLGHLLVAVTDRGVCAVTLGDSDVALARRLAAEFPAARVTRVDDGADKWLAGLVTRVARTVGTGGDASGIPLDLRGTTFQWKVWEALRAIPAGETRTYQAVARAVGSPRAIRAVGAACAANRVAVLVPCHRVIRADGSLAGYRWGPRRKAALLEREGAIGS
jgi:AraC family transcriptional regulator of adaptative response/methylated-DNA-[protein]-cysteine methyltransferase